MKIQMQENPWIKPREQEIKVSSADSLSSTITPLFGFDPKMNRDWNEEF